jgi:hypothetical protein
VRPYLRLGTTIRSREPEQPAAVRVPKKESGYGVYRGVGRGGQDLNLRPSMWVAALGRKPLIQLKSMAGMVCPSAQSNASDDLLLGKNSLMTKNGSVIIDCDDQFGESLSLSEYAVDFLEDVT